MVGVHKGSDGALVREALRGLPGSGGQKGGKNGEREYQQTENQPDEGGASVGEGEGADEGNVSEAKGDGKGQEEGGGGLSRRRRKSPKATTKARARLRRSRHPHRLRPPRATVRPQSLRDKTSVSWGKVGRVTGERRRVSSSRQALRQVRLVGRGRVRASGGG